MANGCQHKNMEQQLALANRNNNPGNLKDPKTGSFRTFSSPQEGFAELMNDLEIKKTGKSRTGLKPDSTLAEFASVYAPSSDKNDPAQYTANLANFMGVRPDARLHELDTGKWAEAIAKAEGYNGTYSNKPNSQTQVIPQQEEKSPSFSSDKSIKEEVLERKQKTQDIRASDQNKLSKILQEGGNVAGLASSLAMRSLSAITPNFIERPIAGALQGAGKEISKTPIVQKGVEKYGQFAEKHPEAAKNIGAVGEIASLIPTTKALTGTLQLEKGLLKTGIKGVTKGLEKTGLKTATDDVLKMIQAKPSTKQAQSALKAGQGQKTGLLGNITLKPDTKTLKAADTVRGIVDPSKTITENIGTVRNALNQEAINLKNQLVASDRIYTFKELQSKLKAIPKPISVKANTIWNKQFDLVRQAAMDIAKQKGGKVSSLLDARKAFDDLVEREIPNLYSASETPMKEAIKTIRREMNDFISDNLPQGSGFKESLARQSSMYDAIDGMSSNAVSELGTNLIQRTAGKYPITSGLLEGGIKTTAGGGLLKALGILP